jgi:peptide/nickel transport system substrate-binding protein
VDEVLGQALRTVDDAKRETLLQETAEIAIADQALVPLFYQDNVFATRKGYRFAPRADGFMAAFMITPE